MHDVTRDGERLRRGHAFVTAGVAGGSFRPVVGRVFEGLDSAARAYRCLEGGAQAGRIVVSVTG
ncbi:zinc-binding dehydrogenase [Streptomyces sp. CBMA123]|uniref:zinc-binding dehydrogenase n=1 Tax=Streptomyces sp. CBMA123 TaxID=1896313 RepID=UPI0021D532D7|nr:zinc-binding dehydrogenase [Streptomyces sp. CBMA123]